MNSDGFSCCAECHHIPSCRYSWHGGERCRCKCHDLADRAPKLKVACEYVANMLQQDVAGEPLALRLAALGGMRAAQLLKEALTDADQ